jgi:tRNA(Met) C34 N-acetyltransferase TmcA
MALFARARRRFISYLPLQLSDPLRDLDAELAVTLLAGESPDTPHTLDEDDWRDLHAFINTHRSYESCLGAIHKLTREAVANPLLMAELTPGERQLLIARVLQQRTWEEVIETCEINGKDAAVRLLRPLIQRLVRTLMPERL